MLERDYKVELYEIYKNLLTDREREYFEYYYYEDYSLNEVSELYDVSKSYVSKFVNQIDDKLVEYESALKLYERRNKILDCLDSDSKSKVEEFLW